MTPRYLLIPLALVCFFLTVFPHSARAESLWDLLFGSQIKDTESYQNPALTKQAPFINPQEEKDVSTKLEAKATTHKPSTLDLGQPHRSPEVIAEWGADIAAEALSLKADTAEQTFKHVKSSFTAYGFQEYQTYLEKAAILPTLKQNNLRVVAIVAEPAQVLREGKVDNTYHWLVKIPMMVTFYDKNMKQLDPSQKQFIQNRYLTVQIQIGRFTPENGTNLGIQIERWVVSAGK